MAVAALETRNMSSPSALITDQGKRVRLRLKGRFYELTQHELRRLLSVPEGPAGLGITIDGDRLSFEFSGVDPIELTASELLRRLAKRSVRI
jgi:hypothetical protein